MRHSPQRLLRALVVPLLLQVTVVGAWAPHALAARPDAAAHVEAAGTPDCPVAHDHGHCLTCQATTLRVLGADAARLHLPTVLTHLRWHRAAALGIPMPAPSATQPRAPPIPVA